MTGVTQFGRYRRTWLAALLAAVIFAACVAPPKVDIDPRFREPVPVHAPAPATLNTLGVHLESAGGLAHEVGTLVYRIWRGIAGNALRQAGYVLYDDAACRVSVRLEGRTRNGSFLVDTHPRRNLLRELPTLLRAPSSHNHRSDTTGTVTIRHRKGDATVPPTEISAHGEHCKLRLRHGGIRPKHARAVQPTIHRSAVAHASSWVTDIEG